MIAWIPNKQYNMLIMKKNAKGNEKRRFTRAIFGTISKQGGQYVGIGQHLKVFFGKSANGTADCLSMA
jgi:hypothetical protein